MKPGYGDLSHHGAEVVFHLDGVVARGVAVFETTGFGDELLAGKSTKIEWIKPVFADDVLSSTATVTKLQKRNPKNGLVEISIEAYNQNGELVLTDVTEAIVKCRLQ